MDLGLRDRNVLIVGGARGIGFASALRFAEEGARIVLADINVAGAEASASRLAAQTGAKAAGLGVDLRSMESVERLVRDATAAIGELDVVVNSAAVLDDKTFAESSESDWLRMIDVCLQGPMRLIHAVLPGMTERGDGRIVCLASDAGRVGQARLSYYAAAKAGVIAFVKSVAQEAGGQGVRLNVVSPGATNTELRMEREQSLRAQMGEEKYARRTQTVLRMYPLRRIGEPDDIAGTIVFLASDRASWITGQVVSVNGGFVMP